MLAGDIVETGSHAEVLARPPLLVLDRVRAFLDEHGLGTGELQARRIGEGGGSNFTFLLERETGTFVLRRPPRPPLPPSAHDVVREAKLQLALREAGFARLPTIVAVCEDESLLGVPFYVMTYIDGLVPADDAPSGLESESARRGLGDDLVDALVEIHEADVATPSLAAFGRPGSYNERQVRRFAQLWELNKTREVAHVEEVSAWLAGNVPDPLPPTAVHGDFRLGNTMVGRDDPSRILAVLDWEMGTIGDPRADVGYLLATYSEPGGPPSPLGTSLVTTLAGFPSQADLVERYVARSGRDVEPLAWFEGLALWKAAVFCEAIYGRYLRGELGAEDERAARFERGRAVPGRSCRRGDLVVGARYISPLSAREPRGPARRTRFMFLRPAVIIVALGIASAAAANPNELPALAYASDGGGGSLDVYVLPSGAADPRRLTTTKLDEFSPSWSPGGRSVAYRVNPRRSDVGDIWVMRADGTQQAESDAHASRRRVVSLLVSRRPADRVLLECRRGRLGHATRRDAPAQSHEACGIGRVSVLVSRRPAAGVRIASRRPVRDLRDASRRIAAGQPHPQLRARSVAGVVSRRAVDCVHVGTRRES